MEQKPILLISTPRSGSDWLASGCLGWRLPDYFREYFNPVTNFPRCAIITQAYGSESAWQNIAVPWEAQEDLCEYIQKDTWGVDPYRFTKENWGSFKIGFFRKHFDCFALLGHRASTFPGQSDPRATDLWWDRYFRSLEFNRDLLDPEIARVVDRALPGRVNLRRKMVAAQVIATYQTARECHRYEIPILEYRKLLSLATAGEVREYLRGKIPAALWDDAVADRVVATRRVVDKSGEYLAWGVEPFALSLIEMLPPEFQAYF